MALPSAVDPGGFSTPPFSPRTLPASTPSPLATQSEPWVEVLVSSCHFGLNVFLATLKELCLHPERNSSLILRADPLPPRGSDDVREGERLGLELVEEVGVRLMPKQPKRDAKLEQRCLFYHSKDEVPDQEQGLVLYVPKLSSTEDAPFYYPPVQRLAFRWEAAKDEDVDAESEGPPVQGKISLAYLPWPETPATPLLALRQNKIPRKRSPLAGPPIGGDESESIPPPATILSESGGLPERKGDDRLQRTCLALLERLYKHGYGTMVGYRKRVVHDVVVPRDRFQDLYLVLKDRHRHLDSRAPKPGSTKVEDVKRHVFKVGDSRDHADAQDAGLPDDPLPSDLSHWGSQDVAVAAFLMLLWKEMYPGRDGGEEEWHAWGRPAGGFVDLGCGNGLLVHILTSEGYDGKGYELRARRTWPLYPPKTQSNLVELPIDFPSWFPDTVDQWQTGSWPGKERCIVRDDCFIVGNHADEITPWIPLLSLIPSTPVPSLSLPCCMHTLDASFDSLTFSAPPHAHTPPGGFEEGLESGQSRYKAYLMWLGWCGLMCGWEWEKEPLRVPSTRGWGIVARKRWASGDDDRECREWALVQVQGVRTRGNFKVRVKEGKDH